MDQPTKVVGRRVFAFLFDLIFITGINFVIFFALKGDKDQAVVNGDLHAGDTTYINLTLGSHHYAIYGSKAGLYFLLTFVIGIGYFVVWPGLRGVTLGKLIAGIKIVKDDGSGPPGIGRAFARQFLLIVDYFPYIIPMLTGFICAMSSKQHKRIGDMVASTLVVKKDAVLTLDPAVTAPAPPPPPFQQT